MTKTLTGLIVGFVDTGDINSRLKSFEAHFMGRDELEMEIATQMLAVCIRGIFMKLEYPLGQYPTTSMSDLNLMNILFIIVSVGIPGQDL